jgi:trehalose-6-phosphatase
MGEEVRDTENSLKNANEVEDRDKEKMVKQKKITYVRGHYRKVGNKKIRVKPHYRNVPNPEKERAKKKRRR